MALLFCDSFDHYTTLTQKGYVVSGNTSINGGTGRWLQAARTRSSSVSGSGGTIQWNLPATKTELVVGVAFDCDLLGMHRIDLCETGTVHLSISVNGSGHIEIRRAAGGTLLATGIATIAVNTYAYVEVRALIDDTTGAVEVRVNETTDATFTGDTRNGGTGVINNVKLVVPYLGSGVSGANCEWDDLVIMDTTGSVNNDFLGDVRVEALYPNANGNSSQLVGQDADSTDNYANVDEAPPDSDTTYNESSTVGDKDSYAYTDITSTIGTVHGVQVLPFAKKTDAGTRKIQTIARSNGVEDNSADKTLTTSYLYYPEIYEEDPDGPQAWTIASVNAAEFGVGISA